MTLTPLIFDPFDFTPLIWDAVVAFVESGERGSKCPVLTTHHDSDGEWSPDQAASLLLELDYIRFDLSKRPPIDLDPPWKKDVAKTVGLSPHNLLDCFFDVDGEPLVDRLRGLAETSVRHSAPILFQ